MDGGAASCPRRRGWTRAPLRSLSPVFDGHERSGEVTVNLLRGIALAVLLIGADANGQALGRPPEVFVDRGACPGECCTYGAWLATRTVDLYRAPGETVTRIGQVAAGSAVVALTGEVRTKAGKFVVRKASPPYRPGDVIWVYTNLGEGFYRVWRAGEIVTQEISVAPDHQNPDDWGYYERQPVSRWWVRVRRQDGHEGWTNSPERFSGSRSCG